MKVSNPILFNVMSAASNATTSAVDVQFMFAGSVQATFSSASAAGAVKVQASNDTLGQLNGVETPVHWTDITNATATVTAGASVLIPLVQMNYRWIRVVWTPSNGAGTISSNGFFQGL